ncbi:hypothetical protein F5Y09DRAFT_338199 [Xylaria sp. FL1042]|nr:hypothetical protein F5Y09DRAFT_338199 [Xylaria sp. FL1042]
MGLHNSLALSRLPIGSLPWSAAGGKDSSRSLPVVVVAVVAALLPAAYSAYVLRQAVRRTTVTASVSPPDPLLGHGHGYGPGHGLGAEGEAEADDMDALVAIPPAVCSALDQYVVARERVVSEAVPLRRILPGLLLEGWGEERKGADRDGNGSGSGRKGLLETYLATTMRMFTWTPQAFAMKHMVSRLPDGAAHADTFSTPYLDACLFGAGDRVCGVYVVRGRIRSEGGERVFLDLSPPEGWRGPTVAGVLDCGFVLGEENGEEVVRFVNETVLWRRKDEKPTLLEGTVSRWLHTAMVGWMMVRGVEAVSSGDGRTKAKVV